MPHGVYFRAATSWPHMFLTLSPTYMGLAQRPMTSPSPICAEVPDPAGEAAHVSDQADRGRRCAVTLADQGALVPGGAGARNPTRSRCCAPTAAQHTVMENANALAAKAIHVRRQSMLKAAAGAHLSRQPLRLADAAVDAEICIDRLGGDVVRDRARRMSKRAALISPAPRSGPGWGSCALRSPPSGSREGNLLQGG